MAHKQYGYLLYVKLSFTRNEGEFLRRYRLDEPAFPYHSTADQFFSEAQFEAYRRLGEHVGAGGRKLGALAFSPGRGLAPRTWKTTLGAASRNFPARLNSVIVQKRARKYERHPKV